jgi:hypothetical protein
LQTTLADALVEIKAREPAPMSAAIVSVLNVFIANSGVSSLSNPKWIVSQLTLCSRALCGELVLGSRTVRGA